jgi:hypothetical protein
MGTSNFCLLFQALGYGMVYLYQMVFSAMRGKLRV